MGRAPARGEGRPCSTRPPRCSRSGAASSCPPSSPRRDRARQGRFEASLVPLLLWEAAGLTTREIGETYPSQVPGKGQPDGKGTCGRRRVVSPWNFPLYLSLRGFAYALALGNAIVLKPSEESPLTGGLMLAELLADAGFPDGVFNVVTTAREGAAMVGGRFVEDDRVKVLCFTGSTAVGRSLATACAETLQADRARAGGKNPMLVLDDAGHRPRGRSRLLRIVPAPGQICMSCDKVLVHRSLYDRFVERLVAKTSNFVPTSPDQQTCVIGPLINERQLRRIERLVDARRGPTARRSAAADGRRVRSTPPPS